MKFNFDNMKRYESPISRELAEKLDLLGYDGECTIYYRKEIEGECNLYKAPFIGEVLAWLRSKGIIIVLRYRKAKKAWQYDYTGVPDNAVWSGSLDEYETYEEAAFEAINACLTILIYQQNGNM